MSRESTIYRAAWVVPVDGPPVQDGAVQVDADGRIRSVGPAAELDASGAAVVDLGSAAILPGLVNVHAHPELTILRGRVELAPFPDWIARLTHLKYEVMSPDTLRVSTWLGVAEAIAAGVTCLAAPDDAGFLLDALVGTRLRGRVYREAFGPEPERAAEAVATVRTRIEGMRDRSTDLAEVGISPHAPYTVSSELFARLAAYAESENLPVCIHAAESEAEERYVREGAGPFADRLRARGIDVHPTDSSPVRWLEETGIYRTRPLLVHCVRVDDGDIAIMAEAGVSVAHCPVSNAKLAHGLAPVPAFLDAGIPVGLGSDSVAANNRVDILEEARFAALARGVVGDGVPDADAVLEMATLGGARALGLADRIGSLTPGKDADLTAVRLDRPRTTPPGDPRTALVHAADAGDVVLTAVRGRVLYRDGEFATLDWGVLADAGHRAARELDSMDTPSTGTPEFARPEILP